MDSVTLKVQERAVPSRGRARLHASLLGKLEIKEGDEVEVYRDAGAKPVVVTVFADTHVEEGMIRLSTEDIATLGTAIGSTVTVKKRPPLKERIKKTADETAEEVKSEAAKAGESIKGRATAAKETVEKSAQSLTKKLKEKDI